MFFQALLLFLAAFLGGTVVLAIRRPSQATFQGLLVFSGGYLFAITVLHLLPDLFALHPHSSMVGLYLLVGFFLQLLLELLSKGVEHGHLYDDLPASTHHQLTPWSLLLSLCIHAFLDGVILNSPHACASHAHGHGHAHGAGSLLLGILLHKLPVAFALASVLSQVLRKQRTVLVCLLLFALA
ncbi:MAG: ZIP zinc transporter [Bacteroidota bacterium]